MDFSFSALAASSSTSVSSVLATGSVFSTVCTASTASVTTAVSVLTAACADSTASAGAVSSTTTGISSFASASACCSGAASPTVFSATTASIAVSCTSCVVSVLSTTGAVGAILEARCSSFACSAASFAKRRRSRGSLATREADASGGVNGNTGAGSASSVGFWLGSSTSRVTGRFSSAAVSTTRVLAYCSANFCKARLNVVTKPNCSIRNLQSSP